MATAFDFVNVITSENPVFDMRARKIRAVVVDDSANYREVICALLELEDFIDVVGRAEDGADAIQAIAHLQPDLLIMDICMPVVDGLSAAAFIAEHFPATEIVLMSADNFPELRTACLASGAHGFIHKPHLREQLMPVLRFIFEPRHTFESKIFNPAGD